MNLIILFTIWERVEDLVPNPKLANEILEPGATGAEIDGEWEAALIVDPGNRTGYRYRALKTVDALDVAKEICEASNGRYVYTFADAWYGMGG